MSRWFCGGCSSVEVGKPAGVIPEEQAYSGPQCEQCWEVYQEELAAEEAEAVSRLAEEVSLEV